MLYEAADALFYYSGTLRRWLNYGFYQYLAKLDPEGQVTFMNYGYKDLSPDAKPIQLDESDEANRYCLQMYHKVAGAIDLTELKVLEVGCGRGGGASFVTRFLKPKAMTGLDYCDKSIAFAQDKHKDVENLNFVHGDAEALPFGDGEFDAVVNVESSHCYGSMPGFLSEVVRVLRPGGHFLWVDHRPPSALPQLNEDFKAAGFTELKNEDVTDNVLSVMAIQGEKNKQLIDANVPGFATSIFYSFAGVEGTRIHNQLGNRELVYTHKVLKKGEGEE